MVKEQKTSNPAFQFADYDVDGIATTGVTNVGVMLKSLFYISIMCITGAWAWTQTYPYANVEEAKITLLPIYVYALVSIFSAFVIAVFTIFMPRVAWITAPAYSAFEGVVLGFISASFEATYPGIIVNTLISTIGVFAVVAILYGTGIIVVNNTFKTVLLSAMCGILLVYFADILLSTFGGYSFPMIHQQGNIWAILFSVGVILVAGLNFAWDFQNIKDAQDQGAPKYFEAYLAFGFMLTLVWLYVEVLRLWSLLSGKKD